METRGSILIFQHYAWDTSRYYILTKVWKWSMEVILPTENSCTPSIQSYPFQHKI